ncbi:hypothetical protein BHU72_04535 [Desulfuribacillus stibiiarsenatis]|uniref:Copper amine oxidase-like N-terminal domain-containing protein n=1 Tax=Desulfuribacillus stibiiarsenatis TaxID=1390249 RepID=A0A1E5L5F4_9FIRM|nr:trypsin-like peptidase domain-containing protein [Desulfuribacillus stibiiarsenatis]OEH85365.1 hypothetical protein BHU72_04535 [Desulfuribacillus stibiiarsenatis]
MRKVSFGFILGIVLSISVNVQANTEIMARLADFKLLLNGNSVQVENTPLLYNGRTYLPVREISNILGYDIDYIEATKSIMIQDRPAQQGTNTTVLLPGQSSPAQAPVYLDVHSAIIEAVDKAKHSVVGVVNMQPTGGRINPNELREAGSGSGVIYRAEDNRTIIITNHHVIERASRIYVTLPTGEQIIARLIGSDQLTDLAVLEVTSSDLKGTTLAVIGNSAALRQGEPAIAIGNPLGQRLAQTVTAGIISGTQRFLPVTINGARHEVEVIQTDAAINPGNSGGALLNIRGELIGINSAKIAMTGVEGIGFAIPINKAQPIISDILTHGRVIR